MDDSLLDDSLLSRFSGKSLNILANILNGLLDTSNNLAKSGVAFVKSSFAKSSFVKSSFASDLSLCEKILDSSSIVLCILDENFSPSIILSNSSESPKNEISSILVIILNNINCKYFHNVCLVCSLVSS